MKKRVRKNGYKKKTTREKPWIGNRARVSLSALAIVAAAGCLSLALIFSYDFITQLNFFNAKQIQIEGLHRVSRSEVLHLAGIQTGMNVLMVNLPLTRKRLAAHPWIADAEVRREIPSGIVIRIREETPLAVLQLNRKYLLNTRGRIFVDVSENDPISLPCITGLDYADLNQEGNPSGKTFSAIMEVLRIGLENDGALADQKIDRIQADREIGLTVYLENDPESVKLGFGRYAEKFQLLERVQNHLKNGAGYQGTHRIDLDNPERIVIHPRTNETSEEAQKEV